MSETLPGYSAYTKGSPEPPTPQEVIERQRLALRDARIIVIVARRSLEEGHGWEARRIADMLRDAERTLARGLGER